MKGMATAILGCTVIWSACQTNSSGAVDSSTAVACRVPQDSILAGLEAQNAHFRGVGGGAAAVSIDGHLVFSGAFGLADVEHDVPMSASESRFQVASVMKALTAATALKLHEKGVLSLDAPVSRYIEDFPESPGGATTVRLLAGHLGGSMKNRMSIRRAHDSCTAAMATISSQR